MNTLVEQLNHLSALLTGCKIAVDGKSYDFRKFELDTYRDPPVADGFVPHLCLNVCATINKSVALPDGTTRTVKERHSFAVGRISTFSQ